MKKHLFSLICSCLVCLCSLAEGVDYRVVPLPNKITLTRKQPFQVNANTFIVNSDNTEAMKNNLSWLAEGIKTQIELTLKTTNKEVKNSIVIKVNVKAIKNKEGYRLTVTDRKITIEGGSAAGVFYGIETLLKSMNHEKTKNSFCYRAHSLHGVKSLCHHS